MQADWEAEFAKYKASPEYQKVNRWVCLPLMSVLRGSLHQRMVDCLMSL